MNRIFFKNNPYPNGHAITEFVWSGRLKKGRGLVFDFHLVTEDYYADDNDSDGDDLKEIENRPDWEAKIVWANFHQCTMSSTFWNGPGFVVGTKDSRMDFSQLLNKTLQIDPLPDAQGLNPDELAINIYLLGHDICANHKLSFTKQYDLSTFDIEWSGNIALFYSGDHEFKYSFKASIEKIRFEGIYLDKALSLKENEKLLQECLVDYHRLKLINNRFEFTGE